MDTHVELDAIYSRYGISGAANGGGGGGYQNAGGSGGSNIGTGTYTGKGVPIGVPAIWNLENPPIGGVVSSGGGRGGYSLAGTDQDETVVGPRQAAWGGDGRKTNGGHGGHPLEYDINRTFFGGGGGAGEQDDVQGGAGGRGGGLVYITSFGTMSGNGIIEVNGQTGENSNPLNLSISGVQRRGNDGADGGGAAGSILIENTTAIPSTIYLDAIGGNGGDQVLEYASGFLSREASGTGGSGAGGSIPFTSGSPIQNLSGGVPGETNSPFVANFKANGTMSGADGIGSLLIPMYDLTLVDEIICTSTAADLIATVVGTLPAGSSVEWYDQEFGGTVMNTGLTYTTPVLTATTTYYVTVCPGTFRVPVTVTITLVDDATFVSANFCSSTVNTITSVATTGGVYIISAQTGSGVVTINSGTGVLAGFTVGDQVTIQYMTPTGGCQNSSTQVVNVTALDNAAFTTSDFCSSTINVVSAVAISGGVFAITSQTGSGLVTINSGTGILSSYSVGDQVTIEYTTPAGGCQNSSTQVVNVTSIDDATFASVDFCESAINEITMVATTGGAYSIFSQTGSGVVTIDGGTGVLVGFTSGDQITIQYTTPVGGCQNSSTQIVNVIGAPIITITDPAAVCAPNGVDITAAEVTSGSDAGNLTYWLNAGATSTLTGAGNITSGTVFYIQLENANGCQSISPVNVSFNAIPVLNSFIGGSTYCVGDIVTDINVEVLGTANYILDYTLDGVAQTVSSTTGLINIGNTEGTYVLTNLADANCSISLNETQVISVNNIPGAPSVNNDIIYCAGESMHNLTVTGTGGTYNWYSDVALTNGISTGILLCLMITLVKQHTM